MRIGIIGGGGAGLTAAWLLEVEHDVTLYERAMRLGGHAWTIPVEVAGQIFPMDVGFEFSSASMFPTFGRLLRRLDNRELEMLGYAARGLTNKEIGKLLFISDRTVQGHLQNVYQKLGVGTRTEAVTVGLSRGIIALTDGA